MNVTSKYFQENATTVVNLMNKTSSIYIVTANLKNKTISIYIVNIKPKEQNHLQLHRNSKPEEKKHFYPHRNSKLYEKKTSSTYIVNVCAYGFPNSVCADSTEGQDLNLRGNLLYTDARR